MFRNYTILILCICFLALVAIVWNFSTGFLSLSIQDFFSSEREHFQVAKFRLHRVLAVLLAGISVPVSGFVLQEYFRNPLAGSEVLGISSVASLAVACYIFLSSDFVFPEFLENGFLSISAILGSLLMMFILLLFSKKISDKSFLIIFGFLISALSGAFISVMQLYGDQQSLKNFILWSFGANNQLSSGQLLWLSFFTIVGILLSLKIIKPLMGMGMGEEYARSLGVRLEVLKYLVILATSLLSASVTAFMGPILFIGIVVPHFCRMLYNPSKLWHQWLLNILVGICVMQFFSVISEYFALSMNIITSLFGIPVILMMLMKKENFR